jgi:outer membrane protein OmpA-like peptidoglycan-associated protein
MKNSPFLLASVAAFAFGGTAFAQEPTGGPSYDCALYNECSAPAPPTETVERGATRGWNLSRTLPAGAPAARPVAPKPASTIAVARKPVVNASSQIAIAPRKPRLGNAAVSVAQSQEMSRIKLAQGISFVSGSASLTPAARQNVDRLAAAMLREDKLDQRFRIEGNTDSVGDQAANMALSKRRADAVAAYLVSQGVGASRLVTVGYGFDNALAGIPGTSAANRRVEAKPIN